MLGKFKKRLCTLFLEDSPLMFLEPDVFGIKSVFKPAEGSGVQNICQGSQGVESAGALSAPGLGLSADPAAGTANPRR